MGNTISNINFTGRCPQIRQAQWVCHNISANFPHISSTNFTPIIDKFEKANLNNAQSIIVQNVKETLKRKIIVARVNYNKALENGSRQAFLSLAQLKESHIGNCSEVAKAAATILKANGVENVTVVGLKRANFPIDHVVCVFNRDGSKFDGVVNNKTIIVDAWSGMVDFAGNMFKKYENMYKDYFFIPKEGKFTFRNPRQIDLSQLDKETILKHFPQIKK